MINYLYKRRSRVFDKRILDNTYKRVKCISVATEECVKRSSAAAATGIALTIYHVQPPEACSASLLWRSTVALTYLKVKSNPPSAFLLPVVLVLLFWSWSWSCYTYTVQSTQLERLEHMKDLGVIFDSELNF